MTKFALVGDVGGTNARLALCDMASGEISQAKTYSGQAMAMQPSSTSTPRSSR